MHTFSTNSTGLLAQPSPFNSLDGHCQVYLLNSLRHHLQNKITFSRGVQWKTLVFLFVCFFTKLIRSDWPCFSLMKEAAVSDMYRLSTFFASLISPTAPQREKSWHWTDQFIKYPAVHNGCNVYSANTISHASRSKKCAHVSFFSLWNVLTNT